MRKCQIHTSILNRQKLNQEGTTDTPHNFKTESQPHLPNNYYLDIPNESANLGLFLLGLFNQGLFPTSSKG